MCFAKEKKEVKSISKDPSDIILDEDLQHLEILGTVNHSDGVDTHFIELNGQVIVLFNTDEAQKAFFQQLDDVDTNLIQF